MSIYIFVFVVVVGRSRVMQKLLDVAEYQGRRPLTPDQNSLLVTALKNITLTLSKSVHGYHVIERCLQKFPYQYSRVCNVTFPY